MDFVKYHGAGNDFIIIDNLINDKFENIADKTGFIKALCHRRTGVGADGLIELKTSIATNFRMIYYNSDGREGTMCGNAGRCVAAFAYDNNIAGKKMKFEAIDGLHIAEIIKSDNVSTEVDIKLNDVLEVKTYKNYIIINTGSPHYIAFEKNIKEKDVYNEGKKIRDGYSPEGINVNFVEHFNDYIYVRTYERGVENETLSCGTGVTAAAIASYVKGIRFKSSYYTVLTNGGKLFVRFSFDNNVFKNVWLKGGTIKVFKGKINI